MNRFFHSAKTTTAILRVAVLLFLSFAATARAAAYTVNAVGDTAWADTATSGTVIDERDGQEYGWVTIGTRRWTTRNLNYKPDSGISHCYQSAGYPDAEANCAKYGRLYDWTTAMNVESKYKTYWWEGTLQIIKEFAPTVGVCPTPEIGKRC